MKSVQRQLRVSWNITATVAAQGMNNMLTTRNDRAAAGALSFTSRILHQDLLRLTPPECNARITHQHKERAMCPVL